MQIFIPLIGILLIFSALAGCTGTAREPSYSVDDKGVLSLSCAPVTITEEVLFSDATYTRSRIIFHSGNGDVVSYLGTPEKPVAATVYAPGAGEKPDGHEDRMVRFAAAGYAFLFVDTRGNGGESAGIPFSQQLVRQDFIKFEKGEMPQYYMSICDLHSARQMLSGRYNVPVYAMGSSNGGRYTAVAAGTDPAFAGYVGISTSDWGLLDSMKQQGISGNPERFAASIEPGTCISKISPRPVWIFHAKADPIIPFESGKDLYEKAGDPKTFIEFSGNHGINPDTDNQIIMQWAQIYGTRG